MKIIAGLGNPGLKYSQTRHNVGFMAVDKLAELWGISSRWKTRKNYELAEYRLSSINETVILLKPQTFMNLSGEAVADILNWYKITPLDLLVIHDDLDLPPGKLRLRAKGSSGGHRGIESIIGELGTDVFCRVKIGVDRPPDGWEVSDYVLSGFTREEIPLLKDALQRASEAALCILEKGIAEAMNRFN